MRVWLRNSAYFFLLRARLHRICKKQTKKQGTKTPRKNPAKNPQNTRKNPQKPANPENRVFGLFLHTVASFDVVFARHLDKFQKELLVIV